MEKDELELSNDIKIRRLKEEEVSEYKSHYRLRGVDFDNAFAIERSFSVDKFSSDSTDRPPEAIDQVMTSLRLFDVNGDVRYGPYITKPISEFYEVQEGLSVTSGEAKMTFFDKEYTLSSDDCERYLEFWEEIRESLNSPEETYGIALDKFSTSFQRDNENDRLLDSVIALEAIYLKSGEAQEMSFKLSQRGALYLSDNLDKAKDIKQNLRDAYNLRSTLVHGSQTTIDHEFMLTLHNLTRKSISKFLKSGDDTENHDKRLNKLDTQAITPVD